MLPSRADLHSHEGRSLIRVAAQVMRTLPIESRVDPTVATDHEVTALIANRARELEHGLRPHLDEVDLAREVVAMTEGLLAAT